MLLKSYKICSKIFEHGFDPPPFLNNVKKNADLVEEVTPYLAFLYFWSFEIPVLLFECKSCLINFANDFLAQAHSFQSLVFGIVNSGNLCFYIKVRWSNSISVGVEHQGSGSGSGQASRIRIRGKCIVKLKRHLLHQGSPIAGLLLSIIEFWEIDWNQI